MSHLIAVSKGADYLEVHPDTLDEHKRLGWSECPPRAPAVATADEQGGEPEAKPARGRKVKVQNIDEAQVREIDAGGE